ncbi:hypothetical protein NI17_016755 [Thermobifida halotolerans]|uniref:Uncharacterized protein n=1 Tax=Thermobifida halotolerans TaxID=483545 RepID=A0A399G3F1_9ACTN|nr:hypothetical protein [Thermobifida halotolerans]UOE18463.1 hypothetical protein NI17_016755 [Thermobifida halotolerans]
MPPGMEAPPSRSSRRRRIGIPLGAMFIGCVLVPTLPASADATLVLRTENRSVAPGVSFSLPLSVENTLGSSEITITDATATADSSAVRELEVTGLPETLGPQDSAGAEVVGAAAENAAGSEIRVDVVVSYSYETPCAPPSPSHSPSPSPTPSPSPSPSGPPSASASADPSATADPSARPRPGTSPSPTASPSSGECAVIRTGTAEISAWVTVDTPIPTPTSPAPTSTPTRSPDRGQEPGGQTSAPPSTSTPDRTPPATRSPSPARTPQRPPAPHSPVSTRTPDSPSPNPSIPSRGQLPTDAVDLPELAGPADEYAELPMVTPGEEDGGNDAAATVAQEDERVDPLVTPFVLLLVLMLLLLLATPLGPVRRVRVRHAYVGRRRRH